MKTEPQYFNIFFFGNINQDTDITGAMMFLTLELKQLKTPASKCGMSSQRIEPEFF